MILSPTGIIGTNLQSTLHYVSGRHGVVALILGLNAVAFPTFVELTTRLGAICGEPWRISFKKHR
jgi:hypothetical protein